MAISIQIVLIKDLEGNTCFPQTNGEAITITTGAGEQKKEITLQQFIDTLFASIYSDLIPVTGKNINIGELANRFYNFFVTNINAKEITTDTIKNVIQIDAKSIKATEKIELNGAVLTKDLATGNIKPSAGTLIEGACWN